VNDRRDVQSAGWLRRALPALGLGALVVTFLIERGLWSAAAPGSNSVDLRNQFFPLYEVTFDVMAAGRLPLWNPYHMTGAPWLATLQTGFFYPPHVFYLWLPTGIGLALSHVVHLVLIAISTAAFARKADLGVPAACLAAILFTFCATLQWWLFWPNMLEAGAWLPLGCVAVLDVARGTRLRGMCLLAFAAAMSLLAGHTQVTVFVLYAWATLLAALVIGAGRGARDGVVAVGVFAGALVLGVLVSAIQTFPTLQLTLESTRTLGSLPEFRARSVGVEAIASLSEAMAGSRLSFGAVALALAPAALLMRHGRWLAVWALVLGAAAYALAFASATGLMNLYLALPGIGWFRQPHRLLFLANFCAALLAGVALDGMIRSRERRDRAAGADRSALRATVPVSAAVVVSLVCAFALALSAALDGAYAAALRAAVLVPAVGLLAWRPGWLPAGIASGAVLLVAAVDMLLLAPLREPLPYSAAWSAPYRESGDFYRNLATIAGEDRVAWLFYRDPNTKLAHRYRLRRIDDWEPLHLRRHFEYFGYLQHGTIGHAQEDLFFAGDILPRRHPDREPVVDWYRDIATRRRLLDLAAVRWFLVPGRVRRAELEAAQLFVERGSFTPREFAYPRVALYENPHALPRAYVTYRIAPAPPREALLALISLESFDPMAMSYVEGDPGFEPAANAPARGAAARIVRDEDTRVEVEATLKAPGLLVLADAYARDWRASVDGEPASILPVNHLFRGVPVPAGRHRVRFEYRPRVVPVGAATSLAGTALLVGFALRARTSRASAAA
jgi:hypothetical protein